MALIQEGLHRVHKSNACSQMAASKSESHDGTRFEDEDGYKKRSSWLFPFSYAEVFLLSRFSFYQDFPSFDHHSPSDQVIATRQNRPDLAEKIGTSRAVKHPFKKFLAR